MTITLRLIVVMKGRLWIDTSACVARIYSTAYSGLESGGRAANVDITPSKDEN